MVVPLRSNNIRILFLSFHLSAQLDFVWFYSQKTLSLFVLGK